ncbi:hypothetical protein Q7P37_000037 [Cladosporium fusiforme]
MAKDGKKKGVANKHLHARIAYLHEAANYLSVQSLHRPQSGPQPTNNEHNGTPTTINPPGTLATDFSNSQANTKPSPGQPSTATFNPPPSGLPLQLTTHLSIIAQKAQIRLSKDLKHTICKICSSPLIEGQTCSRTTENLSKGGRKLWANVLVVKCLTCGACKRFPIGAKKQKRKALRVPHTQDGDVAMEGTSNDDSREMELRAKECVAANNDVKV